jgi:glycerol 3-phosphatase-1
MEGLLPKLYGDDAVEIPGARSLLQDLIARSAPWTIVTSGTVPLVTGVRMINTPPSTTAPSPPPARQPDKTNTKLTSTQQQWLDVLALPTPPHNVPAESVTDGKPDPACYALGRERLGLAGADKRVLVFEDSPAGIIAGKEAGCKVLAVVTSHTAEQVLSAKPDWVVRDLASVRLVRAEGGEVVLEVRDALVV